jgi:DNA-binding MarR family transcriptional regulator
MQSGTPSSNHVTIDVLQRLYFSESKPKQLKPIDLSVLSYLILRRTADHNIYDSQQTIAERLGSERKAVASSLARLQKLGWVTVGGRGNGRSNAISIHLDGLPAAQPIRAKITQDAKLLAFKYQQALSKMGRRKFPKNWAVRQAPSAQRVLTKCGGDLAHARAIVSHALNSSAYKKRGSISLYHLLTVWSGVTRSFQEKQNATPKGETNNEQHSNATA